MFTKVSTLPTALQNALSSLRYNRADISVKASEAFSLRCGSGQGQRAFVCVVNLETGDRSLTLGSWGGANMFNPQNAVDLDDTSHPILPNMAVITGSEGEKVFASIAVAPATLAPMLPSGPTVDARDMRILACYKSLKSGTYRTEALARLKCEETDLERLAAAGLLKRARNGATQITTEGKNACESINAGML